jgi:hypothetical protein
MVLSVATEKIPSDTIGNRNDRELQIIIWKWGRKTQAIALYGVHGGTE